MSVKPFSPGQTLSSLNVLRLFLLGPPIISWIDAPLSIPRRMVRACLYRLACETKPIPRAHLHLLFWPDETDSCARRNLSHLLTHVRRALPHPETLVTSGDTVWLNPDGTWCDVIEFHKVSQNNDPLSSTFRDRLQLYRGPFLDGFALPGCPEFEHWVLMESSVLERQYLERLGTLAEVCTSSGEDSLAIHFAQKYLDIDPLCEDMHRRLIQLYAGAGDRHLALQQYQRCANTLQADLGVQPLPETRAAYQAVLVGSPRFPKPVVQEFSVRPAGKDIPLIGRQAEMRQLEDVFGSVRAGKSHVVLISGEPGIGKSRLIHDFSRKHQAKACFLTGSGHAGEQSIPYQPVIKIVRSILGFVQTANGQPEISAISRRPIPDFVDPAWLSDISPLLPEIRIAYPDLPLPSASEPESAHARLFDALSWLVMAYADRYQPVVLCLDDIHWMDSATQAWLVHTGRILLLANYPILILGAYRSEELLGLRDLRQALLRAGRLADIKLSGLAEGAVGELLQHFNGDHCVDGKLAGWLHQVTGGNPFYLIETLRKLQEEGLLSEPWREDRSFSLPRSVSEAIQARLERLTPLAQQILHAGAVLGHAFRVELLGLTAGRSHSEIMLAIDELLARNLWVEEPPIFRFVHEITRQQVLENLGEVRQKLLHRRAGRAYQRLHPDSLQAMASHFEMAGDIPRALEYHEKAAQSAQRSFAWQIAEFHLGRILELEESQQCGETTPGSLHKRGEFLVERAHMRHIQGMFTERDADLNDLSDLGDTSQDDHIRLLAVFSQLRYLVQDGNYSQVITCVEQGLSLLENSTGFRPGSEERDRACSRLLANLGLGYYFTGKPDLALQVLKEASDLSPGKDCADSCGRIQHFLGHVYLHLGEYHKALECQQCAYSCHQETGDIAYMPRDLADIGGVYKKLGNYEAAQKYMQAGLDLASRSGSQLTKGYCLAQLGSLCLSQGDYASAQAYYQQVLAFPVPRNSYHSRYIAEAGLGWVLYHWGDASQSLHWLRSALEQARENNNRRWIAETLIQIGMVNLMERRSLMEKAELQEGLSIAGECQAVECMAAAQAALARQARLAGNPTCASEFSGQALAMAQKICQSGCQMWAEIESGLALLEMGDPIKARDHTLSAVALADTASQEWIGREEAYWADARVLQALGQEAATCQQEAQARAIRQEKARQISDLNLRRKFLSRFSQ